MHKAQSTKTNNQYIIENDHLILQNQQELASLASVLANCLQHVTQGPRLSSTNSQENH